MNKRHVGFAMAASLIGSTSAVAQLTIQRPEPPRNFAYFMVFNSRFSSAYSEVNKGPEVASWCRRMGGHLTSVNYLGPWQGSPTDPSIDHTQVMLCTFANEKFTPGQAWPEAPPAFVLSKRPVLCTKITNEGHPACGNPVEYSRSF